MLATAAPTPAATTAPRPTAGLRWRLDPAPPADWISSVAACGGSFFHAPPVLDVSLPPGTPLYARLEAGGRTVAVALGVEMRCRLARRARHVRFAALPACAPGTAPGEAAALLARRLAERGAAEVLMESFGGGEADASFGGGTPTRHRAEHLVPLERPDALLARMGRTHRRHVRRGERDGLALEVLREAEAVRVLHGGVRNAAARAAERGDAFAAPEPPTAVGSATGLDHAWGIATFAAMDGAVPLSVAAVGWGAGTGYLLMSGSSEEGYRRGAATWLQWKVMAELHAAGFAAYNLGGTPGGAEREEHPANGLFQFKAGFGAVLLPCRGVRWEPGPGHLRLHRLASVLTGGAA